MVECRDLECPDPVCLVLECPDLECPAAAVGPECRECPDLECRDLECLDPVCPVAVADRECPVCQECLVKAVAKALAPKSLNRLSRW